MRPLPPPCPSRPPFLLLPRLRPLTRPWQRQLESFLFDASLAPFRGGGPESKIWNSSIEFITGLRNSQKSLRSSYFANDRSVVRWSWSVTDRVADRTVQQQPLDCHSLITSVHSVKATCSSCRTSLASLQFQCCYTYPCVTCSEYVCPPVLGWPLLSIPYIFCQETHTLCDVKVSHLSQR